MEVAHQALTRTGLLLASDVFHNEISEPQVIDGLLTASAQITAAPAAVATPAAQTAIVTTTLMLTMSGIAVELDIPDVPLAAPQPPLQGTHLASALRDYIATNYPWTAGQRGIPDIVLPLGGNDNVTGAIGFSGDDNSLRVGPAETTAPPTWDPTWPVVPVGASIAASTIGLRRVLARIAREYGLDRPNVLPIAEQVTLPLDVPRPDKLNLGRVTAVSAGAITHGAAFVLLRIPALEIVLRVFDEGALDLSNSNRYLLYGAEFLGDNKAELLSGYTSEFVWIEAVPRNYARGDAAGVDRIIVGADNIPVRWAAQDDAPNWLGIGATSHLVSVVSTHMPGTACAGCVHPRATGAPAVIPTTAPISAWAGLHLSNELIRSATSPRPVAIQSFPLGLATATSHMVSVSARTDICPRACGRAA
jgi:hypothetical protein